ncbi:hypothetical protein [Candidatus Nitrospira inopinata]|jgi:hypothetical protein|uniref:Uncharacterized protein n=1 Tax=Candidatus Nitrospira inopinata TaxID=1715989 RepID=A0A0S4KT49_9BACT|nr:hypothetical protein [Candidatus Nitrospira inopinata]CUQ66464.1 conserved protein of unknown function [Candidatus Nitrospira inopinata]
MQVIVHVSSEAAEALHRHGPPGAESEELLKIVETFGLVLKPMHSRTDDPLLRRYFLVEVADYATAQRVMSRLQHSRGVEGVYVKPPDELP